MFVCGRVCVCVCVCVCCGEGNVSVSPQGKIHTDTHNRIHTGTQTYIHTCIHTYKHIYKRTTALHTHSTFTVRAFTHPLVLYWVYHKPVCLHCKKRQCRPGTRHHAVACGSPCGEYVGQSVMLVFLCVCGRDGAEHVQLTPGVVT